MAAAAEKAPAQPDYMSYLDDLFGSAGHMGYLNSMTAAGSPGTGMQLPGGFATETELGAADPAAATAAAVGEDMPLSGEMIDIEGAGKVPIEYFNKWRDDEGLANQDNFNLDDYEPYLHGAGRSGQDSEWGGYIAYRPKEGKEGFSTGKDQWVQPSDAARGEWGFDPTTYKPADGVMAFAGNMKDNGKNRVAYSYDNDGKFKGAHFATEAMTFKDDLKAMAPAVMMMLAPFLPGLGAALAGTVQAAAPALGAMGSQLASGAMIGAGTAAITGQNIGKGALMGTVGSGISAMNPAGNLMGVSDKATAGLINSGVSTAVKTGLSTGLNTNRR